MKEEWEVSILLTLFCLFCGENLKALNDEKIIVFFIYLTMGINILFAQDIESNIKERLTDYFNKYTATAKISTPKLNSFDIDYDRKTIAVYASESFAYQPFRSETVETIYNQVKDLLPGPVHYYQLTIYADGKPIENLVPNLYRNKKKIRNGCLWTLIIKEFPG